MVLSGQQAARLATAISLLQSSETPTPKPYDFYAPTGLSLLSNAGPAGSGGGGVGGGAEAAFGHIFGPIMSGLAFPQRVVGGGYQELMNAAMALGDHFSHSKTTDWTTGKPSKDSFNLNPLWNIQHAPTGEQVMFGGGASSIPGIAPSIVPGSNAIINRSPKGVQPYEKAGVGLAATIASDPLSYLAGVGAAHHGADAVAGAIREETLAQAARAAEGLSAADAATTGKDALTGAQALEAYKDAPEVSDILTRGATAAAKARRLGVAGLEPQEINDFLQGGKLADRGIGFAGVKIPGTDVGPAAKLGEGWAQTKAALGDKLWEGTHLNQVLGGADADLKAAARSKDFQTAFDAQMTLGAKHATSATRWGRRGTKPPPLF